MASPENELFFDDRKSCTIQEAVAKLIGWMRGNKRRTVMDLDEYGGIISAQLPYLNSLDGTVPDMLDGQWQAAHRAYRDAVDADEAVEIVEALREAEKAVEKLIDKSVMYFSDIELESARGNSSALEWDKLAEKETGEIHINIDSLDRWARAKYGISIAESEDINSVNESAASQIAVPNYQELQKKGWLSPTKAEGLLITLAFFVEEFAKPDSGYTNQDGKLREQPVATAIAVIAKKADKKNNLIGQKEGAILDRIQAAMRKKKLVIPD